MNNTELQKSVWSARAGSISHYWNTALPRTKWFVEELKQYSFSSIYEVGCNSGRNLYYIHNKVIGGMDICKEAIDFAKNKMPQGVFSVGAIQDLTDTEKYDIVFSSGVLLHIPPEDLNLVLTNMLNKANKYVFHMETNGTGAIINGPAELKPKHKKVNKLYWEPNITKAYEELGYKATIKTIPCGERDAAHFIVVKK